MCSALDEMWRVEDEFSLSIFHPSGVLRFLLWFFLFFSFFLLFDSFYPSFASWLFFLLETNYPGSWSMFPINRPVDDFFLPELLFSFSPLVTFLFSFHFDFSSTLNFNSFWPPLGGGGIGSWHA